MKYFVKEVFENEELNKTAWEKARADIESIVASMGFDKIIIPSIRKKEKNNLMKHIKTANIWKKELDFLKNGDVLLIQFPIVEHTVFISSVLKNLHRNGISIILVVHDLEILRVVKQADSTIKSKIRRFIEETGTLKCADKIIIHNNNMRKCLVEKGISDDSLISLEMFDYLMPDNKTDEIKKRKRKDPIVIAGNLRKFKAGYTYDLPTNCCFNLYGIDYTGDLKEGSTYFGSFMPDELPGVLKGSFGLVWDGPSASTCSDIYGEYLKCNNPHKTSLYLASGLPVVVWSQAAVADFVLKNGVGITVDSLYELEEKINSISDQKYQEMCERVQQESEKIRSGYYFKTAIGKALTLLELE